MGKTSAILHLLHVRCGVILATTVFTLAIAHSQVVEEWRVSLPSGGTIAVDTSGNVFVTGAVPVEGGHTRAILRKYNTRGNVLWEQSIVQGPYDTGLIGVGVDGSGNAYVVGHAVTLGKFGDYGTEGALTKVFVQKYTPLGGLAWTKSYGGESTICSVQRMFVDSEGHVLVACLERVDLYDCQDTVRGSGGNNGAYGVILRYDTYGLGTEIKYRGRGNDRVGWCGQLFRDPAGDIYAHWYLRSDCSGTPGESFMAYAMVKHGLTGGVLWEQIRGALEQTYEELAGLDRMGNRYTLIGSGSDYHLRKYSPMNVLLWDAYHGNRSQGVVRDDDEGNIFALSWGGYFVKYNSQGEVVWRSSGTSEQDLLISFDRFGLIHTGAACFDANGKALYCAFSNVYALSSGAHVFGADARGCEYVIRSNYDQYYLCKLLYGRILAPQKGDLWIAGEKDTIRWGGSLGDALMDIEYSEDGGSTYEVIASGIPADSLQYVWDIPAKTAPKTKSKVKLKKAQQEITFTVSETFGVKPYILTRKDPSTGELVAYDFSKDRWGFWNTPEEMWPDLYWYSRFAYNPGIDPFTGEPYPSWQGDTAFANARDSDFPDWPSFVRAFTVDACYISVPQAIYSQRAVARWGRVRGPWGGSCFGIAGTNALAFSKRESMTARIPMLLALGDPVQVQSDSFVISTVTEIFTHQFGNPSKQNDLLGKQKTPNQTLRDLKEMLRQAETPVRTLTIGSNKADERAYHTILAYRVERAAENSPVWNVHVYDNSIPGDPDPIIEIDTSQNYGDGSWDRTYVYGGGWAGRQYIWLEVPSENYLSPPALPKRDIGQSPFDAPAGLMEIAGGRDASIRIRDGSGNVTGYAGGQVWSDIPGSAPLIVKNGSPTPPYGYVLASGTYSITVDSFKTSESSVYFFTESRTLGYRRSGADLGQRDRLRFDTTGGPALSLANPDPQTKSVMLKTILSEPGLEKVYTVSGLDLAGDDSIAMAAYGTDGLKLASHGQPTEYAFRVEHASAGGLRIFNKAHIPLEANTTHMVTPDWEALGGDLTVYVDEGNDGSIDDTLHLVNEVTGTDGQGSLIPGEYRLEQNYPNPFNPTTTIRYRLPEAAQVHLAVYDLLGREISTLVDERKGAGVHMVTFDGSGLGSGVYFCRITAGEFVQTMKMALVK